MVRKKERKMEPKLLLSLVLINFLLATCESSIVHEVKGNVVIHMERAWNKVKVSK